MRTTELEPEDALPALRLGDVDLAISHEDVARPRPPDDRLERADLLDDPLWLALPRGGLAGVPDPPAGSPVALAGLAAARWVATPPGHRLPGDGRRRLPRRPASSPTSPYHANDFTVLAAFVAAGPRRGDGPRARAARVRRPGGRDPPRGGRPGDAADLRRRAPRRAGAARGRRDGRGAPRGGSDAHAQRQVIRERRGVEDLDLARTPVGEEVVDVMAAEPDQPRHRRRVEFMSPPNSSGAPSAHSSAVAAAPSRSARRCSGGCVEAWRFTTQPIPGSVIPCITRRSGRFVSSRIRCSPIGIPRTRIALQPPPFAVIRSGLRFASARRAKSGKLREVSAIRAPRPAGRAERARPPRRHLLEQRDVPVPGGDRAAELDEQRTPRGRVGAPVEEVPAQHEHGARRYRV